MRPAIALFVLLAACAPATTPGPTASSAATAAASIGATAAPETPIPVPTATPGVEPTPLVPQPQAPFPKVTVKEGAFPILTTFRLKLATVDADVTTNARYSVERYLRSIDEYRNGDSPALPITGPFLAAVSAALKDSAEPGVRREFKVESLVVDHHVQKPWGTHAYAEVTVRLVDHDVKGVAPDQRETGRLRLTGDRLFVTDGWDEANGRWFNGFGPLPLEQVRAGVAEATMFYLWFESWVESGKQTPYAETTYQEKRAARVVGLDAQQTVSRTFEDTTATIERFETIEGIWSGIATVRLVGTVVSTSASGRTDRAPVERLVRVFLFGGWIPEVVDEETTPGVWASGGDLALQRIDINRA